jgi:hypothetical protein
MSCLAPCPACKRHVATDETTCPFCAAALPDSFRDAVLCRKPRGRLGRAAMVVAGAALVGAEACSNSIVPAYGISPPPPDAGADTSMSDGNVSDSVVALYGAPAAAASAEAPPDDTAPPPATNKS